MECPGHLAGCPGRGRAAYPRASPGLSTVAQVPRGAQDPRMAPIDRRMLLAAGLAGGLVPLAADAATDDSPPSEHFALWPGAPADPAAANRITDRSSDPNLR